MTIKTFHNLKPIAACLAAIGMTGCNFGKDDFYGYWRTTDFDANGNRIDYYRTGTSPNYNYYQIEWDFNGTSENAFSNGGTFKQHLKRASSPDDLHAGILTNETFWTGKYQLKGNSGYSAGSLILYYEYGVQLITNGSKTAISGFSYDNVKDWSEADFLNMWKYGILSPSLSPTGLALLNDPDLQGNHLNISNPQDGSSGVFANGVYIQTRYKEGTTTKECGDIEYFRYRLEDGDWSGYCRMLTTTLNKDGTEIIGGLYNEWDKMNNPITDDKPDDNIENDRTRTSYGWKNSSKCSWSDTNYRALGLIKKGSGEWASNDSRTNAELFKITTSGGKITSIDDTGDNDDTDYSDIDR